MDHVVYTDFKAKEMESIIDGSKTMIIRGAAGRKMPYGRVDNGDILYFINNNAEGLVKAKAVVKNVLNSDKMSKEESIKLVDENMKKLKLSDKQHSKWAGKRYLVLIEISDVETVEPFKIDKSGMSNMDDWAPVDSINNIKI